MRLRLIDCQLSRLPTLIGKCQADVPEIAAYVNAAQQRLLTAPEAGDESWYGTWAEVRLNVSRTEPFITLPREIARIEAVDVCNKPIPVFNQFYEYLLFGNGRMTKDWLRRCRNPYRAAYSRNNAVLFTDLTNAPQVIAVFGSDATDLQGTKRVLIQGLDQNNQPVYTKDGDTNVLGEFVTLTTPFATTQFQYSRITGIQKDITNGSVQFMQMDPNTAEQSALLTMEPGEETANYRRYFFDKLPCGCCPPTGLPVTSCPSPQVTAIVKLDLVPARVPTDWLLLQNLEAIIEECQAIRYGTVDNTASQQLAAVHHQNAIRLLNGELGHYLGVKTPSINIAYFGSARLERQAIGTMF
jgi:hypothetical protein